MGPNRVRRDQCDEALGFVREHPGCTAEEVGAAVYPWPDEHEGHRLRRPGATRRAFALRRLLTLLEGGEVVRGAQGGWWVAAGAS